MHGQTVDRDTAPGLHLKVTQAEWKGQIPVTQAGITSVDGAQLSPAHRVPLSYCHHMRAQSIWSATPDIANEVPMGEYRGQDRPIPNYLRWWQQVSSGGIRHPVTRYDKHTSGRFIGIRRMRLARRGGPARNCQITMGRTLWGPGKPSGDFHETH